MRYIIFKYNEYEDDIAIKAITNKQKYGEKTNQNKRGRLENQNYWPHKS